MELKSQEAVGKTDPASSYSRKKSQLIPFLFINSIK